MVDRSRCSRERRRLRCGVEPRQWDSSKAVDAFPPDLQGFDAALAHKLEPPVHSHCHDHDGHGYQLDNKVKTQTGAHAPDITTLLNAANLYPRLISSDQVAKIRKAKYGDLPGKVTSEPVSGPQFQSNFHASVLPLVQIDAVANTPAQAIALDQHTADAFRMWLVGEQDQGKDPHQPANPHFAARHAFHCNDYREPRTSLAIFAALLTMAGFFLAAVALDGAFPRKVRRTAEVVIDNGSGNGTAPTGAPLASASHSEV